MKYKTHILTISLLISVAMGYTQTADEIFENNVEAPPLNPVLSQVTYGDKDIDLSKLIQSGIFDMNVFYADYSTVQGARSFKGVVSIDRPGIMSLKGSDNESLLISYALPDNVKLNTEMNFENAMLDVRNFSDPGGALKEIVLSNDESLEIAFFWKNQSQPVQFESSDGLVIIQQSIDGTKENTFTPVPLRIISDSMEIEVRAGSSEIFKHKGSEYTCYLMESTLHMTEDNGGCASTGYILRAYIIKNK